MFKSLISFWTEEHSLTAMLLLLVINLFVLYPVTPIGHAITAVSSFFLTLALLAGFLTLIKRRAIRLISVALVTGAIVFKWLRFFMDVQWVKVSDALLTLLCLLSLVIVVYLQISRPGQVTAHRIRGAIAEYLLIALLFAFFYSLIEILVPGAFNMPENWSVEVATLGETFYYFSIITLTTVGFGDISAVHPLARSLVMLEALIGQLYPAILIARLVTLEMETRRSGKGS